MTDLSAAFTVHSAWQTRDRRCWMVSFPHPEAKGGLFTVEMPHKVTPGETVRLVPDGRAWRFEGTKP